MFQLKRRRERRDFFKLPIRHRLFHEPPIDTCDESRITLLKLIRGDARITCKEVEDELLRGEMLVTPEIFPPCLTGKRGTLNAFNLWPPHPLIGLKSGCQVMVLA